MSYLRNKNWLEYAMLISVLFVALCLRLYFFVGVNLNDDLEYSDQAYRLATGIGREGYAFSSIDSLRFLMVLPVALGYWLFGVSFASSSIYPLLCSLATIALTHVLARLLFGFEVALAASLMLAFFPLDVVYSTQLVPTVPLACFLVACLLCFVKADLMSQSDRQSARKRSELVFFMSGVLLGMGWMVNEPAPLFGFTVFFYAVSRGRSYRGFFLFCLGALSVLLIECSALYFSQSDFFWRFHVIHSEEIRVPTNTELSYYPRTFFKLRGLNFASAEGYFGVFWYLFVASSLLLVLAWRREVLFLVFGTWLVVFYFQFGAMTLAGKPTAKWIRYLEMVLPFAVVSVSYFAFGLSNYRRWKWAGWGIVVAFIMSSMWFIPGAVSAQRMNTLPFRLIADAIVDERCEKPVYIDPGAFGFVDLRLKRERDIRYLTGGSLAAIDDACVVLNGSRGLFENEEMRAKTPVTDKMAPTTWRLLRRIDLPIEAGYQGVSPILYEAPPLSFPEAWRGDAASKAGNDETAPSLNSDLRGDVKCYGRIGSSAVPYVDLISTSLSQFGRVLLFRADIGGDPRRDNLADRTIAHLWYLDLDQNKSTGQARDGLGAEFNVRLSRNSGKWRVDVDDNNQFDEFTYDGSSPSYRIKESSVQVFLPLDGFSSADQRRIGPPQKEERIFRHSHQFDWAAETSVRNRREPDEADCLDRSEVVRDYTLPR